MKRSKYAITLDNPLYSISEASSRALLQKDLEEIQEHPVAMRFMRRRIPFSMDGYRYAMKAVKKRWNLDITFFEYGHEQIKKCGLNEDLEPLAAALWWSMMETDPDFAGSLVKELQGIIELEKKLAASIPQRELTAEEIVSALRDHLDFWVTFFELGFLWFCTENIKEMIDSRLRAEWKDMVLDGKTITSDYFIEHVYRPMGFPLSSIEQRDLLAISQLSGADRGAALKLHMQKYRHLSLHNVDDEYFNEDYYASRLKILEDRTEYEGQKRLLDMADKELAHAGELLKAADLPGWMKDRIEFIRWFMYLRTESVDHLMLVNSAMKPVFSSISHILGITDDQALHLTYEEIISSVRKGTLTVPKKDVEARASKGYAYLNSIHGSYLVIGPEVDELTRLAVGIEKKSEAKEFKGQIAYKGKATGKARIILDRRFAGALQEGEILVTTMTSPEFVPAMKRAAAIVTNEGGILCHAAIMSRELQKPCVIGTKIATEALKDGDMVEVDADKGIVKILK